MKYSWKINNMALIIFKVIILRHMEFVNFSNFFFGFLYNVKYSWKINNMALISFKVILLRHMEFVNYSNFFSVFNIM